MYNNYHIRQFTRKLRQRRAFSKLTKKHVVIKGAGNTDYDVDEQVVRKE